MRNKWGTKRDWLPVSVRISPEHKKKLAEKHPERGDISKILAALIQRYLEGRIIGLRLEN